jgi:aryl-alcohol dehydrogenase-like predicted oxidoreductase
MNSESSNSNSALQVYSLLGRSGLRVSPLCLGAMTFGNNTWGCDEATSRALLDRYLEVGGNFIGATRMDQLEDNLAALDFTIPPELAARLDDVSRTDPGFPYMFFNPPLSRRILGNRPVLRTPPWY